MNSSVYFYFLQIDFNDIRARSEAEEKRKEEEERKKKERMATKLAKVMKEISGKAAMGFFSISLVQCNSVVTPISSF